MEQGPAVDPPAPSFRPYLAAEFVRNVVHFLSALHRVAGIEGPYIRFWMDDGVSRRFEQNLQRFADAGLDAANDGFGDARELGNDFLQKLQPFSAQLRAKDRRSSNVPSRPRQTGDETASNRIAPPGS